MFGFINNLTKSLASYSLKLEAKKMNTKLKVCGMKDAHNIEELIQVSPDYMGFIFYKNSPRHVGDSLDKVQVAGFPKHIRKVGVFVDEPVDAIMKTAKGFGLDLVQLHGSESPEEVGQLGQAGLKVIKAFAVEDGFDFSQLNPYKPYTDFFLFDTKGKYKGGNGQAFDWNILKEYDQEIPFFLSGGISVGNIDGLKALDGMNLHAVDVNSQLEIAPGLKDIELIRNLKNSLL